MKLVSNRPLNEQTPSTYQTNPSHKLTFLSYYKLIYTCN